MERSIPGCLFDFFALYSVKLRKIGFSCLMMMTFHLDIDVDLTALQTVRMKLLIPQRGANRMIDLKRWFFRFFSTCLYFRWPLSYITAFAFQSKEKDKGKSHRHKRNKHKVKEVDH